VVLLQIFFSLFSQFIDQKIFNFIDFSKVSK